jgi:hypothetical protein
MHGFGSGSIKKIAPFLGGGYSAFTTGGALFYLIRKASLVERMSLEEIHSCSILNSEYQLRTSDDFVKRVPF